MGELERRPNAWALTPLVVFLLTYLVISIVAGDFYKMPITVAFVISSIVAIAISKGGKLSNRIEQFCRGAANSNIMLMVLIFILAGAFAQTAKAMGAVDATVNLAMSILPGNLLAAGIFLAACFISISVGTSVGTIVALAPVAVGIADKTGMPDALMLGVVVSGAMGGDTDIHLELIGHLATLRAGSYDGRIGYERQVIAEHGAAHQKRHDNQLAHIGDT